MEGIFLISLGTNLILFALLIYERNKRMAEREKFASYLRKIDTHARDNTSRKHSKSS
jgi:hypothetical protein